MEPLQPIMAYGADNFRLAAVGTVRGRRSPMVILAAERPSGVSKKSADPMTRKRSRDQRTSSLQHSTTPDSIQRSEVSRSTGVRVEGVRGSNSLISTQLKNRLW